MQDLPTAIRPTWDNTWLGVAAVMSLRSLCSRSSVGAVIVDSHNRVVATGYNGPPAGFDHKGDPCWKWCTRGSRGPRKSTLTSYEDCPSLHAELNALSVCDRSVREGGTIYVTSDICYSCAKAVANSGISRVVVLGDEIGYRQRSRTELLLRASGVEVTYVTD